MKVKKHILSFLMCVLFLSMGVFLIIKPEICKFSITSGILLCGQVLIPSLFPFGVCVLFIINCGICEKLDFLSPITLKLFGLSFYPFVIFLFSMIGGYPIGAKLINDSVKKQILTQKQAKKMLYFCVNAGPAFIVSAVGSGILKSSKIGFFLLFSHIISSFLICRFFGTLNIKPKKSNTYLPIAENFVLSAGSSANAVMGICSYVLLFSVICGYIEYFSNKLHFLKCLVYITEVTGAVTKTHNIYLISFLLGFAGICIWCQILSVTKEIKLNFIKFAFFRIFHGFLSALITYILLRLFPLKVPTFSNVSNLLFEPFVSSKSLGFSLMCLGIVFTISLSTRQNNSKTLEEIV